MAQTRGEIGQDAPVGAAVAQRRHHFVKALNTPLGIYVGALFFHAGATGQHHVGEFGGAAHKDILHHHKLQTAERLMHFGGVGVGEGGLFADDIHRLQRAFMRVLHHHKVIGASLVGERLRLHAPRARPFSRTAGSVTFS